MNKKVLGLVFFTVFLDLVGFGIIIPIQPFYAELLGASPSTVTLLGGSYSLMQFLFAPFWGRLSDRIGRRPVMLVSVGCSCVGYLIFGFATELEWLFAARMLAGLGGANIGTAHAVIADTTTSEHRAKGMGLIGAAFGLGFTLGPAMGGGMAQFGLAAPAFLASALCVVNWFGILFLLPETCPKGKVSQVGQKNRPGFSLKALKHAARHQNVPIFFSLYLILTIAFASMEQVLGLFIEKTWVTSTVGTLEDFANAKQAAKLTAYVLIVIGITSILIQGGLIGRLARRFGERTLLKAGTVLIGLSLLAIPFTGSGPFVWLLGVSFVMAIGSGISNPSLSSLLSQSVDDDEQGGVMGLGQSLSALGRVIGPAIAGFLFEMNHGLPFWVGAALMLVCVALTFQVRPVAKAA